MFDASFSKIVLTSLCESNNRRKDNDALADLTFCAADPNLRDPRTIQVNRTLVEVIRTEEPKATKVYKFLINHHNKKTNWKKFKDRLRLKRTGEAFPPSISVPVSAVLGPLQDNNSSSRDSSGLEEEQITAAQPEMEKDNYFENLAIIFDDCNDSPDVEPVQTSSNNNTAAQRRQLSRLESTRDSTTQEKSYGEPRTLQASRSFMQRKPSSRLVRAESSRGSTAYDPELDPVPISDIPPAQSNRNHAVRRDSSRMSSLAVRDEMHTSSRLSEALAAERQQIHRVVSSSTESRREETEEDEEQHQEAEEESGKTEQPVKISLMDLLGDDMGEDDEEEDEETEEVVCSVVEYEYTCCVCMIKHTGNAFIPCGHTFCRLCSRELYVSKGNCPLCNGFILEILDIF